MNLPITNKQGIVVGNCMNMQLFISTYLNQIDRAEPCIEIQQGILLYSKTI
jgi:hypothetical protein